MTTSTTDAGRSSGTIAPQEDTMTDTTATKRRTITLTGRRPVTITEEEWPIIAEATGDSYRGSDYARHHQSSVCGEVDDYSLRVRQHADGRTIVYGVLDAAEAAWHAPAAGESYRGGVMLTAGADIAAAIRRVGESCRLPAAVIRECIADLPAEEI